jgi:hypothetical protein
LARLFVRNFIAPLLKEENFAIFRKIPALHRTMYAKIAVYGADSVDVFTLGLGAPGRVDTTISGGWLSPYGCYA